MDATPQQAPSNLITRKPSFDGIQGYMDLEYGDYDHKRFTGALNVPVSDALAFRVAGTALKRDGYIENKAGGQIPGVDDDVDGRDHYALRITGAWKISERANLWVMYDRFDEDSSRSWEAPSVCKQSALPVNAGCEPNQFGRDRSHPSTNSIGILMGLEGIIPLGARDAATGLQFDFPRPELNAREVHWDGNAHWNLDEEVWAFGLDWESDRWRLSATGGYQQTDWRTTYPNPARGFPEPFRIGASSANPSALWPTSAFPGPTGFLRTDGECNIDAYQAGAHGGCIADVDQMRTSGFALFQDQLEYWTLEAKLHSTFEGPVNFLLGANYALREGSGEFVFLSNLADMLTAQSVGGFPRIYPGFGGYEKAGEETENYAIFAELYWQLSDAVKITLGMRYNEDTRRPNIAQFGLSSFDANFFLGGLLGPDPLWVRGPLLGYVFGAPDPGAVALAEYYGAADAIGAANSLPELISALQIVPPIERPGEQRALLERPSELQYTEWSGRFVVDWLITPTTLVYAKYNRGFRPGVPGFATGPDLDSEIVDSFEIGAKTRLFGDSVSLSTAAFVYTYHDMQISPGTGAQFEGLNVDVNGRGVEIDAVWQPPKVPNLAINLAYGWLHVEIEDYAEFDERNRTQGNPEYVALTAFDAFGASYIAPVAEVLPLVDQAIATGRAIGEVAAPGTVYPNGIPAYFSRAYLDANGVGTLDGLPADMKGNRLRHSPEHSVNIGAAYSWFLTPGSVTARWDYYWQAKSFGNVFNSPYDKIDGWGQHGASLTFESASNRWVTRLWIRNIANEDNVIARTNRQQIVYGEPRIYGMSVRYNVGDGS